MRGAFSNDNLTDKLCGGCDCTGFTPSVTFVYDANAKTIVVTDASTYPSGGTRKIVQVRITDRNGSKADSHITANDGDNAITISVAALDFSEGYRIDATVVTIAGCISDGHAGRAGWGGMVITSGALGSWDKDNNIIEIAELDNES